jgi:hypothetical protein
MGGKKYIIQYISKIQCTRYTNKICVYPTVYLRRYIKLGTSFVEEITILKKFLELLGYL